jgi:flagellar hook-associated protein 3 FlgL
MVSSNFRVTPQILARRTTANMQATLSSLQQIQAEVSSQKRIQKPSDDPVGMVSSLRLRSDVDRNTQIGRNIDDATAWLGTADNALNSVVAQINKARDLAIQAQNGTMTQTERDSIATQIDDIRQNIIGLANTQYAGRSIFAGTVAGPAYDSSGNYLGNSVQVDRTVAPGTRVPVNVTGDDVFGPAGGDLFTNLSSLSTEIRTGTSSTIDTAVTNLDTRTSTVQARLADIGARTNRVDAMKTRNGDDALSLKSNLSDVEDVDLPKALMDMQMQQVAYQAALQTTAKVIQPSLVDFLK